MKILVASRKIFNGFTRNFYVLFTFLGELNANGEDYVYPLSVSIENMFEFTFNMKKFA